MINFRVKAKRIAALTRWIGLTKALGFEMFWSLRSSGVRTRIPNYPIDFKIHGYNSDYNVFLSIFLEDECSVYTIHQPRTIIDGGANVGFSTAYFAKRYPTATIVAVDRSSGNYMYIKIQCDGFGNVTLLAGGLWSHSGRLRIQNQDAGSWSFRCKPTDGADEIGFRAFTIDEIIDRTGAERCDLLKLHI